jgi:hypothetical protein
VKALGDMSKVFDAELGHSRVSNAKKPCLLLKDVAVFIAMARCLGFLFLKLNSLFWW